MIGVFGGTFDPIHFGHLRSALEISEALKLDRVQMIPSADPPHRDRPTVSAAQRLEMLELALSGQGRLNADDREIRRSGPSYMVDTLAGLAQEFEQRQVLILGFDAFAKLATWHQWMKLFELAHIVVIARPGAKRRLEPALRAEVFQRVVGQADHLLTSPAGLIWFCTLTQLQISASKIRQLFINGESPRYLLPASVLEYIQENQLYKKIQ